MSKEKDLSSQKNDPKTAEICSLMFEMGRHLKNQIHSDASGPSTYLHLETLRYIKEAEQPDMQELADYLRVKSPSATRLVTTLIKDGLIDRIADPNDRRRILLALSPTGKKMLETAMHRRAEAFARVIAPLSASDRTEFARILTIITRHS